MTSSAGGPDPVPSGRYVYRVEARSDAPVEDVWPLLGQAARWRDWSFLTASGLERAGSPERSVFHMRTVVFVSRVDA